MRLTEFLLWVLVVSHIFLVYSLFSTQAKDGKSILVIEKALLHLLDMVESGVLKRKGADK